MMNFLDITENIKKSLRGMYENPPALYDAWLSLGFTLLLIVAASVGMWVFDIHSTYVEVVKFLAWASSSGLVTPFMASVTGAIVVALTFAPAAAQLILSKSAPHNSQDKILVVVAMALDAITDWPVAMSFTQTILMPLIGKIAFLSWAGDWLAYPICAIVTFVGSIFFQTLVFSKLPIVWVLVKHIIVLIGSGNKAGQARQRQGQGGIM